MICFHVGKHSNQLYNTNRFVLQECGDFTLKVSDCEEFVWLLKGDRSGVTQTDILVGQVGLEPTTGRL